ncbi:MULTISPECIES: ribonuclease P protein component [Prevotellaceae]|uniref:ribonuclease P protein component n=1 Tax=Prevotellaceae TaxID=171552 RepID=UPI0005106916|nr:MULTISPECIES: ribonuclease P protein component [Prevotellaceae]KGF41501.1 ribonuclease P [Hoylesella buccalis DNF00985]
MPTVRPFKLSKWERICGRTLLEKLFTGGKSKSFSVFPLRVVYLLTDQPDGDLQHVVPVKMMVSVSKRHFKRAVKRNRVKRQVRGAYRLNKEIVVSAMADSPNRQLLLGFIWMSDELHDSDTVTRSMQVLLKRIADKL